MNHSRRSFVRNTALIGMGLLAPFKNELLAFAGNAGKPFGIQLWTVKQSLYKDTLGVLKQLAADGYKKIEGFEGDKGLFWGMKHTELKKVLDDLGMQMVSSHCSDTYNFELFERKVAQAAEIGMKYLICPHKGAQPSIDHYKKFAEEFNTCGKIAQKYGIRFAYHNHDYSFVPMNGVVPQDIMMQNTDKEIVDFEMDLYWMRVAGVDPLKYMDQYPNRFKLVHVKDLIKTSTKEGHESCVLGKGTIDYTKLLPQVAKRGVQHMIVEQEAYTGTNEMDAAKADADYIKTLRW